MQERKIQGLAFAFSAAVFAALFDLITRFSSAGLTPWQMLLARAAFGLLLTVLLARKMGLSLLGRNRAAMLLTGLTTVAGVICLTVALIRLPIFEALLLLYLYPAFAALFSPFLCGEKTSLKLWGLIGLAFCGTGFILWPGELGGGLHWGHAVGVGAGLLQGLALTMVRRYSRDNNALTPFFYFCLAGAFVSLGALTLGGNHQPLTMAGGLALAAIAVTAALAQLSLCKSLSSIASAEVGVIGMSEIVMGAALGFLLFGEAVALRQVLGGVLVIASGIILALDSTGKTA